MESKINTPYKIAERNIKQSADKIETLIKYENGLILELIQAGDNISVKSNGEFIKESDGSLSLIPAQK